MKARASGRRAQRQLRRAWALIDRLRTGATICQLAEVAGVTPRTIYRDLETLEAAGLPLYKDKDGLEGGIWRLLSGRCPVCTRRGRAA